MHQILIIRRLILTLFLSLSLLVIGCGGQDSNSSEIVNLRVYNGYPGSSSMTLYGPNGPIAENLAFGAQTIESVQLDRNTGTDFLLVIDGAPEPFDFGHELYALYPNETATLFITGRTGVSTVQTTLFRHLRSIAPACRLVLHNSLAVSNTASLNFNFIGGWDFSSDIGLGGYNQAAEDSTLNALDAQFPEENILALRRTEVYEGIDDHPYFILTSAQNEDEEVDEGLDFVWIGPEDRIEVPFVDFASGSVLTHRNTNSFITCLQDIAESLEGGGGEGEEEEEADFASCVERESYSTQAFSPSASQEVFYYHYYPSVVGHSDNRTCDASLRIFSDFGNIFQGEHGFDDYQSNSRIDVNPGFEVSDHFFFVLYGNPVDPRIAYWKASRDFDTPLPDYPGNPPPQDELD